MLSFTACMQLLIATSAFGLGRRCWSSPKQCHLHCLCTICLPTSRRSPREYIKHGYRIPAQRTHFSGFQVEAFSLRGLGESETFLLQRVLPGAQSSLLLAQSPLLLYTSRRNVNDALQHSDVLHWLRLAQRVDFKKMCVLANLEYLSILFCAVT